MVVICSGVLAGNAGATDEELLGAIRSNDTRAVAALLKGGVDPARFGTEFDV